MGYNILVADNKKKTFEEISTILKSSPKEYTIISAVNAVEILEKSLVEKPHVILLNFNSPLINSFEVIQSLKSYGQTRSIPILMIIDFTEHFDISKAFELGIVDIIIKPFNANDILIRLDAIFLKNNYFLKLLKQAETIEQINYIASKSSNSVAIIAPDGKLEWANKGFTDMYECSFKEFKKEFEDKLFRPEHNYKFKEAFNNSISNKVSVIYENKWTTKEGKEKWIQTTLTPIFHEKTGEIVNFIAIESDVTRLVETEMKLEKQNEDLLKFTKHLETTNEILENQRIELEKERQKSDELLLNIFPYTIAKQLKSRGEARLKEYKLVTVLFTDFKGFTKLSEQLSTEDLIKELSNYFDSFDEITGLHYIEKIKTIGDSYMCVGGLPLSNKSNPIDVVLAALEIQDFCKKQTQFQLKETRPKWELRLGIHSGDVIAGVIGRRKFAYDIWGDTVNTASRMETAGEVGKVNISGDTYGYIKEFFDCTYRGKIEVKYKGEMEMYFVNRLKPEFSEDEYGIIPNDDFKRILSSF